MRVAVLSALSAVCLILCIWALLLLRRARRENARLRQTVQSCQLQAQELERQTEALRELRHDLRHYIQVSGEGGASIPPELETLLHTPVGGTGPVAALASFYRRQAESLGAQADLRLELEPVDSRMLPDLCLLLSNLLENAVECLTREGGGWLRARTIRTPGYVTIVVGNSCRSVPKGADGRFLSSKRPGRIGIGLPTIRRIARQYGGDAAFTADGQEFRASVFLLTPHSGEAVSPAAQAAPRETAAV